MSDSFPAWPRSSRGSAGVWGTEEYSRPEQEGGKGTTYEGGEGGRARVRGGFPSVRSLIWSYLQSPFCRVRSHTQVLGTRTWLSLGHQHSVSHILREGDSTMGLGRPGS